MRGEALVTRAKDRAAAASKSWMKRSRNINGYASQPGLRVMQVIDSVRHRAATFPISSTFYTTKFMGRPRLASVLGILRGHAQPFGRKQLVGHDVRDRLASSSKAQFVARIEPSTAAWRGAGCASSWMTDDLVRTPPRQ